MSLASFYFVSTKQISMVSLVLLCLFSTTFCWPSRSSQVEARSFPLDSQSDDNMMARNFKEYLMRRLMEDYSSGSDRNSMAQRAPLTGSTMRPSQMIGAKSEQKKYHVIKKGIKQLCLPGTGCEYQDMGKEAEAKEFLSPNNPSNPGR
ncbi:uncharacterized protein LOC141855264 isoform X2 [Brevipalpus obovatus]|uniref:uncharacterized protein LOC141855264 isoform X2 n=1 Tax=Brevipalpus obovatus TaxID=246614 RepID=UPI003D9F879F